MKFSRLGWAALPGVISIVSVLALWEALVRLFAISPIILPAPSRIGVEVVRQADTLLWNGLVTMYEAVAGLLIGSAFALVISILITEIALFRRAIYPLILIKQVVPTVVFAPILLVWLGYGVSSKVVISAIICFFPVVVNALHGLTELPREVLELATSLGSSRWTVLTRLRLPNSLPFIYVALKPTVALAVIGAVVGEFIGGSVGLGFLIVDSMRFLNLSQMFAAAFALIIVGLVMFGAVELIGIQFLSRYRNALQTQGAS